MNCNIGRQCLVIHLNNRADDIKNEVGYVVIERPSNPVSFDVSLVFDQVDFGLGKFLWWGLS